ncbi:MAG: glutamate 5-kinase [Bacillota bacterium]|nr:glutamate 5-kinase [Bacillota bacterium]
MKKERIVIKVGTTTLTHESGRTNFREIDTLVRVIADLQNQGYLMTLVSSGAIGIGTGKLGLSSKPKDISGKQAASTVGQCELMFMYDKMFSEYGQKVGQLLITKEDVEHKTRKANLISAMERLFDWGVIPIINENDAVAIEEIVYGDNDNLSAIVARLIGASKLIILTDIDGLYDSNPKTNKDAKLISEVDVITPEITALAKDSGSDLGTGGMITKLQAAKLACDAGIDTYVINGHPVDNIYQVLEGDNPGTWFKAVKNNVE